MTSRSPRRRASASATTRRWQCGGVGLQAQQRGRRRGGELGGQGVELVAGGGVEVAAEAVGGLREPAGPVEEAQVRRRAQAAPVLVGDAVLAQQGAQPRLGHARAPRLRAEAHVEHASHARGLQLGDQGLGQQPLVADRPQPRHPGSLSRPGRIPRHGLPPTRPLGPARLHPHARHVVIGARKEEQLLDNLAAADLELSADERARLDAISAPRCSSLLAPGQDGGRPPRRGRPQPARPAPRLGAGLRRSGRSRSPRRSCGPRRRSPRPSRSTDHRRGARRARRRRGRRGRRGRS